MNSLQLNVHNSLHLIGPHSSIHCSFPTQQSSIGNYNIHTHWQGEFDDMRIMWVSAADRKFDDAKEEVILSAVVCQKHTPTTHSLAFVFRFRQDKTMELWGGWSVSCTVLEG